MRSLSRGVTPAGRPVGRLLAPALPAPDGDTAENKMCAEPRPAGWGSGPRAPHQALVTPAVTTHQGAQSLGSGPRARDPLNSASSAPVQTWGSHLRASGARGPLCRAPTVLSNFQNIHHPIWLRLTARGLPTSPPKLAHQHHRATADTQASGLLSREEGEGPIAEAPVPWSGPTYSPSPAPGPTHKGYGLHTILMHQFRGLVVCRRQKKATGARSGWGTSGSPPSRGCSGPGGEGGGLWGPGCSVTPGSAAGAAAGDGGGEELSAMAARAGSPAEETGSTWQGKPGTHFPVSPPPTRGLGSDSPASGPRRPLALPLVFIQP